MCGEGSLACASCSNGQSIFHGRGLEDIKGKKQIVLGIMLITFIFTARRLLALIWTNEFPSDTLLWALNHCAHPTDFNTLNNPS